MKTANEVYTGFAEESVKPLVPHEATSRVEVMGEEVQVPTILLSLEAYTDTHYIMEASGGDEVGWLGTVQKLDGDKYLIGKVFLFHPALRERELERGHTLNRAPELLIVVGLGVHGPPEQVKVTLPL